MSISVQLRLFYWESYTIFNFKISDHLAAKVSRGCFISNSALHHIL